MRGKKKISGLLEREKRQALDNYRDSLAKVLSARQGRAMETRRGLFVY